MAIGLRMSIFRLMKTLRSNGPLFEPGDSSDRHHPNGYMDRVSYLYFGCRRLPGSTEVAG